MSLALWCVDESRWPLVLIQLDRRVLGAEPDFESFLPACAAPLARGARYAAVIDLTGSQSSAARRSRVKDWYTQHRSGLERWMVALGVVAPGAAHRGVMTAMLWLVPHRLNVQMFATTPAALAWAEGQLRGAGIRVGAEAPRVP